MVETSNYTRGVALVIEKQWKLKSMSKRHMAWKWYFAFTWRKEYAKLVAVIFYDYWQFTQSPVSSVFSLCDIASDIYIIL